MGGRGVLRGGGGGGGKSLQLKDLLDRFWWRDDFIDVAKEGLVRGGGAEEGTRTWLLLEGGGDAFARINRIINDGLQGSAFLLLLLLS